MEIEITDIRKLIDEVEFASKKFRGQIWWRGHADKEWDLLPCVFRGNPVEGYEQDIIFRFQNRAPSRYPTTPSKDSPSDWLFLMQHYGLPTRLLDWTKSPLTALYFAVEDSDYDDQDAMLWGLSPYQLNQDQIELAGIPSGDHSILGEHMLAAFLRGKKDSDKVIAVLPQEIDIRMMVQQSTFTIHGKGKSLLGLENFSSFLINYDVPSQAKASIRKTLKSLGVRESELFPDLDHLAKEVKKIRPSNQGEYAINDWTRPTPLVFRPDDPDRYNVSS